MERRPAGRANTVAEGGLQAECGHRSAVDNPQTYAELRQVVVRRGWDYFDVLLPEDKDHQNPEARYVVNPLQDGRVEVTVRERNEVLYHRVFADERATVAALNAEMTPNLPVGPPPTDEELQRSRVRLEEVRQAMIAKLTPEQRRELEL